VSADQRLVALSALWREARFSFAYYDGIAAEWDRLYQEFIPRVRATATDYDYYLELMRFYAHLKDGHSGIFWPAVFDEALGYPPFEIRKVEGRAVIFRLLRETEELEVNGIRPGLAVLEVDKRPVSELVRYWRELKTGSTEQATERLAYFRILTGPRHSAVDLLLREPGGATRAVRLTRSEKYFNDTNLTPPRQYSSSLLGEGIGYFQANQMTTQVAEAFRAFLEGAGELNGLLLDFRYNGGGSDSTGFDIISRLIDEPAEGPIYEVTSYRADRRAFRQEQDVIRTRHGTIAPAAGRRFTGPLVVLIGEQTHSAAESGFVALVRGRPRTRLVGEPTAGSTGQPMTFALPGGALGAVCSRRTFAPDGSAFVGIGFRPDVTVALTQDDLFEGRDSVLNRAIAELNELSSLNR
jgi:C-terminal processing protease CtpA/Prc